MATQVAREAFTYDGPALKTLLQYVGQDIRENVLSEMELCDDFYRYDKHFLCAQHLGDLVKALEGMVDTARPQQMTVEKPKKGTSSTDHVAIASVLGIQLVAEFIKQTPMYVISAKKAQSGRDLEKFATSLELWNEVSVDKDGDGTYYRPEPGSQFHNFMVRGIVKAPLIALASVLLELDMYKEWYPMANMSMEIQNVMTFHKQSRFAVTIPGPIISNREVCLDGFAVDDLKHRKVIIVGRGLEDDECLADGSPVPAPKKGNVRCGLSCCGFVIEALAPDRTKIAFIMNIDPRIPHLPTWLLNWISAKMMAVLLYEMSKAAERGLNPKSKYAQRREERKEVYEYMQGKVDELFGEKDKKGGSSELTTKVS